MYLNDFMTKLLEHMSAYESRKIHKPVERMSI
jgi:hypothetical protein